MTIKAKRTIRVGDRKFRRGAEIVDVSDAKARELVRAGRALGEAPKDADKDDLSKLTNKQLHEIAAAEEVAVETDDNKATLVDKILAARAAKS